VVKNTRVRRYNAPKTGPPAYIYVTIFICVLCRLKWLWWVKSYIMSSEWT